MANTSTINKADALSQIYAHSLCELAEEASGLDGVVSIQQELDELVKLVADNDRLGAFLVSKIIPIHRKRESIRAIFGDGKVTDLLLRFLLVLNDNERLDYLNAISVSLKEIYWARINRIKVEVITAEPMDEDQRANVRNQIKDALGQDAVLTNEVVPDIVGGLKLRIGDQLIDASVATRLAKMRESLTRNGSDIARSKFASMIEQDDSAT